LPETLDAVVVGGGLIGSSIALRLAQKKLRVVVLDQREPGAEASVAAAGILSPQAESNERSPFFDLCSASRDLYPPFAAELEEATGIDVELRLDGVLYVALSEAEQARLDARFRWQSAAGLAVERLTAAAAHDLEPTLRSNAVGGVLFPKDGQVENVRLTRAVIVAASRAGVRFEAGNPARRILHAQGRVRGVEAASGNFTSGCVVLAAGAWSGFDGDLPFPVPVGPARGELVAAEAAVAPRRVVYSHEVYVVPRRDGRILFGATMEKTGFDKRVKAEALRSLLEAGFELLPGLRGAAFHSAWAGLRPCAPDDLPLLGRTPLEGLFLATAHFRNGILLAPLTARVTADLVTTGNAGWDLSPFSVTRFQRL
jgi:glycine oxidase